MRCDAKEQCRLELALRWKRRCDAAPGAPRAACSSCVLQPHLFRVPIFFPFQIATLTRTHTHTCVYIVCVRGTRAAGVSLLSSLFPFGGPRREEPPSPSPSRAETSSHFSSSSNQRLQYWNIYKQRRIVVHPLRPSASPSASPSPLHSCTSRPFPFDIWCASGQRPER